MTIAANDNGQSFDVLFFDSAADDATVTHVVTGFASIAAATDYTIEAFAYAKANGLAWFPTEIVPA